MNKIKIKICGVKEASIIDCCIENKVSYFGLIFYEASPRYIDLDQAVKLINYVKNKSIIPIGVFVNKNIDQLKDIIKKTSLNYIQLHGNEDDDYIKILKNNSNLKVIKSIGVNHQSDLIKIDNLYSADYYLFDYKPQIDELPGGNAKKFNWSLLDSLKINKPWFISGGININNIKEIQKNLIPYGIDISSGVEAKKGIKSLKKINDLMKKINAK